MTDATATSISIAAADAAATSIAASAAAMGGIDVDETDADGMVEEDDDGSNVPKIRNRYSKSCSLDWQPPQHGLSSMVGGR